MTVSETLDTEGLDLVRQLDTIMGVVRSHAFPALIASTARDDDDEKYLVATCPWCLGNALETGIVAVDYAPRETEAEDFDRYDLDQRTLWFDSSDRGDFEDTVYYKHASCGRPVALPNGWREDWV